MHVGIVAASQHQARTQRTVANNNTNKQEQRTSDHQRSGPPPAQRTAHRSGLPMPAMPRPYHHHQWYCTSSINAHVSVSIPAPPISANSLHAGHNIERISHHHRGAQHQQAGVSEGEHQYHYRNKCMRIIINTGVPSGNKC
jgi:hypothetical protein